MPKAGDILMGLLDILKYYPVDCSGFKGIEIWIKGNSLF